MAFTRGTFLGASIRSCTASLSWGLGQPSSLTVSLVEDPLNGDSFAITTVGQPVYFQAGAMTFGGLLQRVQRQHSQQGNPTYEVTVVDPREILEGAQLILSSYGGTVGSVQNLYNVYGWWENIGYGLAQSSEAGMPWSRVQTALLNMTNGVAATPYGGPLSLLGYSYGLDLSQLPQPPAAYRLGGVSMSVLEAIAQICEDGGYEFFVELDGRTIRIRTRARRSQPSLPTVSVLASPAADGQTMRADYAVELRNDITSSFLIGGEVQTVWQTNVMRSYWGRDINGSPITGVRRRLELADNNFTGLVDTALTATAQQVTLSALNSAWSELSPIANPGFYLRVDGELMEVRSIALSASKTEAFAVVDRGSQGTLAVAHAQDVAVELVWGVVWGDAMTLNAAPVAEILGSVAYACHEAELRLAAIDFESWSCYMAHYRPAEARRIGITSPVRKGFGIGAVLQPDMVNEERNQALLMAAASVESDLHAREMEFYDWLRGYATEFLGRKFVVELPFILHQQDGETLRVSSSYEISDGGYLPEGSAPLGLSALNEDVFRSPDGRLRAFAVFNDATRADVSNVSPDATVLQGDALYGEISVDPSLLYTPGPAALVTLQPLFRKSTDTVGDLRVVAAVLQQQPAKARELLKASQWGNVGVRIGPDYLLPDAVLVPLKSNVLTYGPWAAAGPAGKVKVDQDPGLTPWSYGGWDTMALAGSARVSEAVSAQQISKAGTIERAGAPVAGLGGTLSDYGDWPITGIQISLNTEGVSTTYSFQTFTSRPYGPQRWTVERMRRLALTGVAMRRAMRVGLKSSTLRKEDLAGAARAHKAFLDQAPAAVKRKTPHDVLVASVLEDGEAVRVGVSSATSKEAVAFSRADSDAEYARTAAMSWSGLLRPFTTRPGGNGLMPGYKTPDAGFTGGIGKEALDPWKAANDIELYSWGDSYQGFNARRRGANTADARALALRGPLVLSSFGFDWEGAECVPGGTGALVRSDTWKTGPVDLLWDERRGVWTCHDITHGVTSASIAPGASGEVAVYRHGAATSWTMTALNWSDQTIAAGARVACGFDVLDGQWLALAPGSGEAAAASSGAASLPSGIPYSVLHASGDGGYGWSKDPWIQGLSLGGSEVGSEGYLDIRAGVGYGHKLMNSLELQYHRTWRLPADAPATGDALTCKSWDGTTAELEWAPASGSTTSSFSLPTGDSYSLLHLPATGSYVWSRTPNILGLTVGVSGIGDGFLEIRNDDWHGLRLVNPSGVSAYRVWNLPEDDPASGDVLTAKRWDGLTATLDWSPPIPTGPAYSVLWRDSGGSAEMTRTPTIASLTLGGSGPSYTGSLKLAHASSGSVSHTTPARSSDLIIVWPSYDPAVGDIPRVSSFDSGSRTAYLDWVSSTGCVCLATSSGTPPPASPGASGDPCPETPPTLPETEPFISYNSLQMRADNMGVTPGGNGSEAHTWYDISIAANDASQGTSANRPIYYTNQVNGLDAAEFDGTDDYMTLGVPLDVSNGGFTCLMVLKQTASGYVIGGNTNGLEIGSGGNFHKVGVTYIGGPGASPPNDTWVCVGVRYDTATGDWLARDYQGNDTSGSNLQTLSITNSYIGASVGAAVPAYFSGQVAEIVFCNGPISNAEFDGVWNYLVCKYALGNLYKTP